MNLKRAGLFLVLVSLVMGAVFTQTTVSVGELSGEGGKAGPPYVYSFRKLGIDIRIWKGDVEWSIRFTNKNSYSVWVKCKFITAEGGDYYKTVYVSANDKASDFTGVGRMPSKNTDPTLKSVGVFVRAATEAERKGGVPVFLRSDIIPKDIAGKRW